MDAIKCQKMSNQIINLFLILNIFVTGITAEFFEDYADYESKDFVRNEDFNLLDLLRNYAERKKEHRRESGDSSENWPGRWMPERLSDPTPPPKVFHKSNLEIESTGFHSMNRIPMGVKSVDCDDGKTNLTVDWDHSSVNYTCYGPKITPEYRINPHIYCEYISPNYLAMHKCMKDTIQYDDPIPLFGTHRPIWPIYGEYKFVPRQRWLHNLEHGAVVMIYHPCANPLEVKRLKTLVTGCIRRHLITPSNLMDMERPLALVVWGCRLTMSYVNPEVVEQFIIEKGLRGPEQVEADGDFEDGLLKKAEIVTDIKDSKLCPNSKLKIIQNDSNTESM